MVWLNHPIMDASSPVNGLAGIGKSTIARTVAEQANKSALPITTFFFSRQHDAHSNAKLFVMSIALGLAEIFPDFMESISHTLRADGTLHEKSLDTQFTMLFFQPLQSLTLTQPLVVDALDECVPKEAETILKNMIAHCSQIHAFRILITSHPENHITS